MFPMPLQLHFMQRQFVLVKQLRSGGDLWESYGQKIGQRLLLRSSLR